MTNSPKYSSEAIREAWKREAKQRWDGRTHGRGLSLLIVKMLALPGGLMPSSARSPTFEFWRDQNKIRGRFIGVGHGSPSRSTRRRVAVVLDLVEPVGAVQKSAKNSWPVGASRRGLPKCARRSTAILEISDGSRTPVAPISITVFATISAIGSLRSTKCSDRNTSL